MYLNMPQLIVFLFLNLVIFNFALFILIVYMLSKYILPRFVRIFKTWIHFNVFKLLNYAFMCLPQQSKYSYVLNIKIIIFIFKVYYKLSDTLSFAYCLHIDFDVFNIFRWAFICFWVSVALYNVYKSMLNVSISEHIAKLKKSINISCFFRRWRLYTIFLVLIKWVYKKLLYILLEIYNQDVNILYLFLVLIAVGTSFQYLVSIIKELNKPGKKDFSLTSSYMRNSFTLSKFILTVCLFCIWHILIKGYIFKSNI